MRGHAVVTKTRRGATSLLTVRQVIAARDGDHTDGGGLLLRIRGESGSWVYRYTAPSGKRREMGLGRVQRSDATVAGRSITDARRQADEARTIVSGGDDPIDRRDATVAAKRTALFAAKAEKRAEILTLARAARAYHERVIEPKRSEKHAAEWIASLENHVGDTLWHAPIASIEPGPLLDRLLELQTKVPETAWRIRQRLEVIFDDAIFRKQSTTNPAGVVLRKMREAGAKRRVQHFRSLPFARLPDFWTALLTQPGVAARALQFVVLTAARTAEVLGAEWTEIDAEARTWTIRGDRMKGGEEHVVDLTDPMLALIESQKTTALRDPVFVFPSPSLSGKPMTNMSMLVLLRRMKLEDETTVHGFRSSFSTWANESGRYRPDVIEAALAHKEQDRIRAAYSRAKFLAERRELLRDWSAFVTAAPGR